MNNQTIYHVIKDPVHGTMQFSQMENAWIKPFIDSAHFQRLRHVKQLGMGDFIFPGAVHTRFNHSLGCCYVASQIAHTIGLKTEERQLVMLACLLHDIGHGPFSHTFEDLFVKKRIRHEAWTPLFLKDYRTAEFFKHYNALNQDHPLSPEKFLQIEEMIMHRATVKPLLADIVSSQLDADRLDYLLRDSHFCGVDYGKFDFQWMLNSMAIIPTKTGERLGLTHKGIGVVEHYLMARRLMTRNIYFHQKKLALEFFLIKLLGYLSENIDTDPELIFIKNTRLGRFLLAVNQFNKSNQTSENFVEENYDIYKELCDYDIFTLIQTLATQSSNNISTALAKRLHLREMPKIFRLDQVDLHQIEQLLAEFKHAHPAIADWQLALIKTPHQSYLLEHDPILIINENRMINSLDEISLMINAMGNKLENSAFVCIDKVIFNNTEIQNLLKKFHSLKIDVNTMPL